MARFQRHTVPWCSRSSSRAGTPSPRSRRSSGCSGPTTGSTGSCSRTLSSSSSSGPDRTQPVPKATREIRRLQRPAASRSSIACLNRATRVSCHSRWPRKVGELPATARTGPVASWAALKWSANRRGRPAGAPGTSCWRPRGRRARGWGGLPTITTRPPCQAAARRTIPSAWSSSLAMAAKGRPASGAGGRLSSRLNRSISSTTRGSAVSALTSWLRGRARPWPSTRNSSSSAPTVAGPVPNPGRCSSRPSAARHSSSRPSGAARTLRTAPFRRVHRPWGRRRGP